MNNVSALLTDQSTPNVQAFGFTNGDGSEVLLYRLTPSVDPARTTIRLSIDNSYMGAVVAPERFGDAGSSRSEFRAWVERFALDDQR